MKIISKITLMSLALVFASAFTGCKDDSATPEPGATPTENGYEMLANSSSDFSLFLQALDATGLDATLKGTSDVTLFAPTNSTLINAGITAFDDLTTAEWKDVLEYHMMEGKKTSDDLPADGYALSMSFKGVGNSALSLYFNGDAVNGASITSSTSTTNGIVHEIAGVLSAPNCFDHISMNAKMTTFKNGCNRLASEYATPLQDDTKSWSVLVPNETKFQEFLVAEFNTSIAQVKPSDLRAMMNLHFVDGSSMRSGDFSVGALTTMGGDIDVTAGPAFEGHEIMVQDIVCTNGIVQILQGVIKK